MKLQAAFALSAFTALICLARSNEIRDSLRQNATKPSTSEISPPSDVISDDLGKFSLLCSGDDDDVYFRESLLTPMLQVRVSGTEGNARVREHIKSRMSELGWYVKEDQFETDTPVGRRRFTNIVAVLDPSVRSRLTLACHYDSKQFSDDVIESFIGATDSAVSCAMIINLATCLNGTLHQARSQTPPPEKSIQLIFFDGEEAIVDWTADDSLYGSRHLAEVMVNEPLAPPNDDAAILDDYSSQLDAMDLLILLDLVGTTNTQFVNWFNDTSLLYNRLSNIEQQMWSRGILRPHTTTDHIDDFVGGKTVRYFANRLVYRDVVGGIQDDHEPFLRRGVPVLHLITYPFPEVWHTEADNEAALDYVVINNIATIIRVFVAEYLNLPSAAI